jgi:hypothetical protein
MKLVLLLVVFVPLTWEACAQKACTLHEGNFFVTYIWESVTKEIKDTVLILLEWAK